MAQRIKLDLNNPVFQEDLVNLEKDELVRVRNCLKKLLQLDWDQLYRDQGKKWEKIISIDPPKGVDAFYSFRITQARRAIAIRQVDYLRILSIQPDHDATYGKK